MTHSRRTVEPWSADDIARRQAERRETAQLMWHATMAKAREEGRAQGFAEAREQGRAQGFVEARTQMLLRVLTVRFGDLPTSIEQRVREAPEASLDRWAERFGSATTLDDVFAQP